MSLKVRTVIALCCAVLSVALVAGYTASVRSEAAGQRAGALERYGGETARVCVATRDIARGETFSERNVAEVEWLVDLLPEGAVDDPDQIMGKAAASAIAENTPVAEVDVESQGTRLDVPAGLVAASVSCTSESAVGGALVPGSVVDVYVVTDGAARLLCREVQVVQTNASGTAANLSWVTLAVEPDEVEALIAAESTQRLHFVLPSEEELQRRQREEAADASAGLAAGEGAPGPEAQLPEGDGAEGADGTDAAGAGGEEA